MYNFHVVVFSLASLSKNIIKIIIFNLFMITTDTLVPGSCKNNCEMFFGHDNKMIIKSRKKKTILPVTLLNLILSDNVIDWKIVKESHMHACKPEELSVRIDDNKKKFNFIIEKITQFTHFSDFDAECVCIFIHISTYR